MITSFKQFINESSIVGEYNELEQMIVDLSPDFMVKLRSVWKRSSDNVKGVILNGLLDKCIEHDRSTFFREILESDQIDPSEKHEKSLLYTILIKIIDTNKLHFLDALINNQDKFISKDKDPTNTSQIIDMIGKVIQKDLDLFKRLIKEDLLRSNHVLSRPVRMKILEIGNEQIVDIIINELEYIKTTNVINKANYLNILLREAIQFSTSYDTQSIIDYVINYMETDPSLEVNYTRNIWMLCTIIEEMNDALKDFISRGCNAEIDEDLVYDLANQMDQDRFEQRYIAMCSDSEQEDELLDIF